MRECTVCEKEMLEGYYHEGTEEYFCTDECLRTEYTEEEIKENQQDEEEMTLYWTEWDEEEEE
jgi:hypothetical protein